MNNNIDEKLSALYDGELDANEIDEVLSMLDKDTSCLLYTSPSPRD